MTTDATHSHLPSPPDRNTMVNEAAPEGIVSVNDRGRRQGGRAGPFFAMGGVALVVLIGGLVTLNIVKAKLSGPKPVAAAGNANAAGLAHNFNADMAPPLPGAPSASATEASVSPACPDGTMGNALRGQDGSVVRNASGQSLRVCANGQVVGTSAPSSTRSEAIPVTPSGQRQMISRAREGTNDPSARPSDGPMMLNGGKYGVAPVLAALSDPQSFSAAAQQGVQTVQPRKDEGLLTAPPSGSLEAELTPSTTPMVQATRLSNLNLLLPKGRTIDCGMSMRIISALAGQASCVVTSNVYSANGKVLLIERGSEAVGEYRSGASIGQKRLFVLWNRIITPSGVVINLNSPGADELGSTGLTGKVADHWFERIGSAFLLSTIQDAISYEVAQSQANAGGTTLVLGNTAQTGNQMAERVLQTTINIQPTIYKNQGDRAVIYVARDLDFSNVYRLHARP